MNTALILVVAIVTVLQLLMFGAGIELLRQIQQLRMHAGLVDHSRTLDFNINFDTRSSSSWVFEPLSAARYAVLFLSDSCATCVEIATGLPPTGDIAGLYIAVEAPDAESAAEFISNYGLSSRPFVHVDRDGALFSELGVSVTPSVVRFERTLATSSHTVPSSRQMDRVLDWLRNDPLRYRKLEESRS